MTSRVSKRYGTEAVADIEVDAVVTPGGFPWAKLWRIRIAAGLIGKAFYGFLLVAVLRYQSADPGHVEHLPDLGLGVQDPERALIAHEMRVATHELPQTGAVDFGHPAEVDNDPAVPLLQNLAAQVLEFLGIVGELRPGLKLQNGDASRLFPGEAGRTEF